jgi:hypothetical protein
VPTSANGEFGSGCGVSSPAKIAIVLSVRCTSFSIARIPRTGTCQSETRVVKQK